MHRIAKKLVLVGVCVALLGGYPLWAQGAPDDPGAPADISHGTPRVDGALQKAIATLQGVLADLPSQADDKAREALQRNIDRLQAGHDQAIQSLRQADAGEVPTLKGIDKAIDSVQKSMDRSTAQLQKLLDGGTLPQQAVPHLQAALGSLAEGRTVALEVLNRIKAGEQASGRPDSAGVGHPGSTGRPEQAHPPDRPSHPDRPSRPERGGRP